jgi:mono/diheme cytochrome c family protein
MRYLFTLFILVLTMAPAPSAGEDPVPFTAEQANRGERIYLQQCAECHGRELWDGAASPLAGSDFRAVWSAEDKTLYDLYYVTWSTMPVTAEGTLSPVAMAALLAYMLQENGYPAGERPLPEDPEALKAIRLPVSQ